MKHELPDFTHLPLWLFLRAHAHVLYQFLVGFTALLASIVLEATGNLFLGALTSILAAIAILIAAANFLGLVVRWKQLRDHNFAVIGRVIDVSPAVGNPDFMLYKVEFHDPEGTRREGLITSETWEKTLFAAGDRIKLLYDPRNPQSPTNYSAYESFQGVFLLPKRLRALLDLAS